MARYFAILMLILTATAGAVWSQTSTVGEVHFANSGSPAAQGPFFQGLAQLHNFEYGAAADLFQQAEQIDPDFAMAYWGEAMTYNHPVWAQQDRDKALKALARLGQTPDVRIARARTEREQDYMRAVEILYGDGDKASRNFAYADAMSEVHRKYPDDVDAAAFHALALLGTAHAGRDFAIYMRAAAILEPLFPSHPNHPGIAHYLIHSYDDPIHAPLGLRAARAYSKIAPSAAHAQHMCSHIFVAMGMWDDVVTANEAAMSVVNDLRAHHGRGPAACGHIDSWLEYGYLQQGRVGDAKKRVAACYAAAKTMPPAKSERSALDPDDSPAGSFAYMRSRYLFDTEDWTGEVAGWRLPRDQSPADIAIDFVDGYTAARLGKIDEAKRAFEQLKSDRDALTPLLNREPEPSYRERVAILEQQLGAMIQVAQGQARKAIDVLRSAAATEEKLPFEFGPPFIEKPSYELLGEVLFRLNDTKEARAAFEKALARTPDRTAALVGLMRSAEKMGDRKKADEVRAKLQTIWHRADRPMSTEAR
jgi:tetratricopeptide (TPR) repeat protein